MDEDRCYYGDIDENGKMTTFKKKERGPGLKPAPELTPNQVAAEQFDAFSSGTDSDIEDAFAFVSPKITEQHGVDVARFRQILDGTGMEGIIGCAEWEVMSEPQYPSEDTAIVGVRILPKPIPGCVRISGRAGQEGMTWPAFYRWQFGRRPAGSEQAGCWMLEQMIPVSPKTVAEDPVFMKYAGSGEGKNVHLMQPAD
jgi:hypothetical protein